MEKTVIQKSYRDFPAGHRQHLHDGHCRFMHGHDWGFDIVIGCERLDDMGFVVDFGKLKSFKDFLTETFDHKFLVSTSDPLLNTFRHQHDSGLIDMVEVPDTSCEGLARYVFSKGNALIRTMTNDRAFMVQVTVHEDSKNRAIYPYKP